MKETNDALFSKMAWQVANNEDKLWVDQLKAKYCARYGFFNVQKKATYSITWKSILDSRQYIMRGACYMIGNGRDINVWTDPWLPYLEGFRAWPSQECQEFPQKVFELFIPNTKIWNMDLLKRIFDEKIIEAVKKLIVPDSDYADHLAWLPSPDGKFSIKSVYNSNQQRRFQACKSGNADTLGKIWKAQIHERSKKFLWRCVSGALPLRSILASRIQITGQCCLLCVDKEETGGHLFFECSYAKAIWFQCWGFRMEAVGPFSLVQWVEYFLDKNAVGNIIKLGLLAAAITMEDIWSCRNMALKNIGRKDIPARALMIKSKFSEFSGRYQLAENHNLLNQSPLQIQDGDDSLMVKINFDAAIRDSFSVAAASFLSPQGQILGLISCRFPLSDSDIAEARAAKMAIEEARNRGWLCIHIIGDSLNTINQITGTSKVFWKTEAIMKDISGILSDMTSWKASKISRGANAIPHELAKWAATTKIFGPIPAGAIPQAVSSLLYSPLALRM